MQLLVVLTPQYIYQYLTPPSTKGVGYEEDSWEIRDKYFNKDVISVTTKDGIPTFMQDDLDDNQENYSSITHEE